ncbi:hypothetical protein EUTSA_v10012595mg [Eutrema salsugineum]|uniref:DUF7906 domain-containing protein n=1 Tax=Eutrema salsugineum TaxID=72664 RepID=V4N9X5_EUTSA|nr:uncharacterized protein LOC18016494 [Eutrema salsugineum]ESQ42581.1 hypothetical protein EUTSA_v10012595mg [Eutrema salsugineum]
MRRFVAGNRSVSKLIFTICVAIMFLPSLSHGAPHKTGKSSVFSLFNLKDKSRFWSESVFRSDFDDLESSVHSNFGVLNYTKSGSIASYLELMEIDSVYLPVPVNFIFIGFDGKGNQEFKLLPEELERWFNKIDHMFEHTRIPQTKEVLNPFYKTNIEKQSKHHLPIISRLNYNFSVHAIQMGEKVTAVIEHAIKVLARKDDISTNGDEENALRQVDVEMMEFIFSSLVEYFHLGDAYNVFILNPKRDIKRGKYGYRRGFSDSEISYLKENKDTIKKLLQSGKPSENILAFDMVRKPLYEKHPMLKFSWTNAEETDTAEWYNACQDALNKLEQLSHGKDAAELIQNKVLQLLQGKNEDMKLFLEKGLRAGDISNLNAECLTDIWIGKGRWAFIDLTAGPFSWGPSVGGEGVRTELSFPNVGKTIGAVAEISEDEAEDKLQAAIQDKFSVFGEKDHQAVDILLAEIDVYELFAFKHCKGRKVKLALCEELDERMRDLKTELQSFEGDEHDEIHKKKAIDALKRMESWNLFSDEHEEFQNYTVARDTFLAHLGSTLWGSMRHIISPSVADGAFHHYEKISFQLIFITQEKVRQIKQLPVDLKALMDGLSSLLLPSQKPMFSQHMLTLSEDPALAMAFSVARRAAAVPLLLVNGTYRKTVRSYLDSSILQYQLQRLNDHTSLKGGHAHSRSTLEVPIFWLINGDPLLIDKHYQAKALSNMVVVVQSEASSWESHLQCNGRSLLWDLRTPMKAAMASVAEHLAGLLPLHLVYSVAHESAIEDWTWSVGCNPFSITSQGWHLSQFQSDTIGRSYMITALEESIQAVNSGIHLLRLERTNEKSFKPFKSRERELMNKYKYVVSLWRRLSTIAGETRYGDAMRFLYTLEEATSGFLKEVNATVDVLHPIHCTKMRKVKVEMDMTTIPALFVVVILLYAVFKPRAPKPKIN